MKMRFTTGRSLLLSVALIVAETSRLKVIVQAADDSTTTTTTTIVPAASASLLENQRVFADDLVAHLYTKQESNECTSALGVSMAFSLLYPSASGASLDEMQAILGYPASESSNLQLVWEATQDQLEDQHDGECLAYEYPGNTVCEDQAPVIEVGNSVWVPVVVGGGGGTSSSGLVPSYQELLGDMVKPIDFTAQSAGSMVNDWVNKSTQGLIDSIVDDGPLDQVNLIAINSLYLKAQWTAPFSPFFTNEDVFYTSVGRSTPTDSKARFMHKVDFYEYSDTALPGFQLLKLGFRHGEGLSILFALPGTAATTSEGDTSITTKGGSISANAATGTTAPTAMVKSQDVWSALPSLLKRRVAVALPMFNFESKYEDNLKSALKDMGLQAPFNGGLCIYEADSLCQQAISTIIQKTVIDVNELGVKAAAVTAIIGRTSAPPPEMPIEFLADHPFQFFIIDEDEQVVLFEGRVGNPGISEEAGAEPAKLQTQHADADFWSETFGVEPAQPDFSSSGFVTSGSETQGGDDKTGAASSSGANSMTMVTLFLAVPLLLILA